MDTFNIRNLINLRCKKVVLLIFFGLIAISNAYSQKDMEINLPNYDERWIHYGISFGLHSSTYKLKYSDAFVNDTSLSRIHSINPQNFAGFSLGLLVNLRLAQYFDLRFMPKVNFYENYLEVNYTDGRKSDLKVIDPTMVEFPLLLKYKSERRGNIRLYWVGGVNGAIEATGKKATEEGEKIKIRGHNVMAEFGFGLDLYFPLFKLSPEIRFSKGLIDIHRAGNIQGNTESVNRAIQSLTSNTVTFYLHFE